MSIYVLKLSNAKGKKDKLSSTDILSIHLGYYMINGKVTYSTGIPIAEKPKYVILTLGNDLGNCYLCHVKEYAYQGKEIYFTPSEDIFEKYSPDKYKKIDNVTWLVFDSMQKIEVDFLDQIRPNEKISTLIKSKMGNCKKI